MYLYNKKLQNDIITVCVWTEKKSFMYVFLLQNCFFYSKWASQEVVAPIDCNKSCTVITFETL